MHSILENKRNQIANKFQRKDIKIVGAIILDPSLNKLLLQQVGYLKWTDANKLSLPGGGVEDNETDKDALLREIYEEAGIEAKNLIIYDIMFRKVDKNIKTVENVTIMTTTTYINYLCVYIGPMVWKTPIYIIRQENSKSIWQGEIYQRIATFLTSKNDILLLIQNNDNEIKKKKLELSKSAINKNEIIELIDRITNDTNELKQNLEYLSIVSNDKKTIDNIANINNIITSSTYTKATRGHMWYDINNIPHNILSKSSNPFIKKLLQIYTEICNEISNYKSTNMNIIQI